MAPAAGAFAFRLAPGSPYTVEGTASSVAVGDFNGDGLPDFAVASNTGSLSPSNPGGGGLMSVLLADRGGGFRFASGGSTSNPILLGAGNPSVAVGDFNGDGKLDLVATENAGAAVLLGNGDGTFTPAPSSPTAVDGQPLQVVVGDFNRDGKPDLAVLSWNHTVSVLLGHGDGTFATAPGSPIALGPGTPGRVAAGDFNRDGKLDLAISNLTQGTVSVLLGNGDATFTPAPGSPIALGGMPSELAVGDFNGDGKPDLAVGNAPSKGLSVLLGRGDGTFSPAPGSPVLVGLSVSGLAVGDFNADRKQDIAFGTGSGQGSGLDLLLGDGGGGFRPAHGSPFPVPAGVGQNPASPSVLAGGRFDGRPGVILSPHDDYTSDYVSLLLAPLASDPPVAALTVRPKRVTAGHRVKLDASGSSDPLDRRIVDYRWDLGNRQFNRDTGRRPTITQTFRIAGTFRLRVRITNAAGKTAIATVKIAAHHRATRRS
jgi:hypothetical protein